MRFQTYNTPVVDIPTAVAQVVGDACPLDCPGFTNSQGNVVCGQCCTRQGQKCPAFYDMPNGCGPGDGKVTALVQFLIDNVGPSGSLDLFTPFCNFHDICYSTPGLTQDYCDQTLLDQLLAACGRAFPSPMDIEYGRCQADAQGVFFVLGTLTVGRFAYNEAQSKELAYIDKCTQQCNDGSCAPLFNTAGDGPGTCDASPPPPGKFH